MKLIITIDNVDKIKPEIDYILAKLEKILPIEEQIYNHYGIGSHNISSDSSDNAYHGDNINYSSGHTHTIYDITNAEQIINRNYIVKKENFNFLEIINNLYNTIQLYTSDKLKDKKE